MKRAEKKNIKFFGRPRCMQHNTAQGQVSAAWQSSDVDRAGDFVSFLHESWADDVPLPPEQGRPRVDLSLHRMHMYTFGAGRGRQLSCLPVHSALAPFNHTYVVVHVCCTLAE